jgi:hypothetical protein
LTATPDPIVVALNTFQGWSGDCASFGLTPVCTLTMSTNSTVGALFGIGTPPPSLTAVAGVSIILSSALAVPESEAQVIINGRDASSMRGGPMTMAADARGGINRVEGVLVRGAGKGGTWRFDLSGQPGLKVGSLRAVAGTVVLLTSDSVLFRLDGKPGERVVFMFQIE